MQGILNGLRVVEGTAFVAAPSGGMALAQLGADVIRFDPIGGSLDFGRWPLTHDGKSLCWAGLNKGKRSICVDFRDPRGQELLTRLICAPGEDAGIFSTNFPARGWLSYESLKAQRGDLIMINLTGRRDGGSEVDYTVNPQIGFPMLTGPAGSTEPVNHVLPAWDFITGQMIALAMLAAERHRRLTWPGTTGEDCPQGRCAGGARALWHDRRSHDQRRRSSEVRELSLRRFRPRFRNERRSACDGRRADSVAVEMPLQGDGAGRISL